MVAEDRRAVQFQGKVRAPARFTFLLLALAVLVAACSSGAKKPAPAATTASTGTTAATAAPAGAPQSGTPAATSAAASGQATAASAATAQPISASRIETVKLAYDLLLDRYVKPLKSNDLLSAAWSAASHEAGGQVAAPKLGGDRNADWQAFSAQYQQLFSHGGQSDGKTVAFAAVDAMATSLHDDHTYFINPQENALRQQEFSGGQRFVGVGITLSNRAPFTVAQVIAGGPADKAGIKPGDAIVAVDGQNVERASQQDLGNRLRGDQAGSQATITIRRGGQTQDVTVTRAEIVQPAIETKIMPDGIGYIALHSFSDAYARFADGKNIAETLDAALNSFEQAGVKGWIFDVRDNGGGSEQTLAEVAGRFLPSGLVLVSTDRAGKVTQGPVDGHLFRMQRPMAVLINGQSGSSSELLSATLKEYGRAHLVGQRTAGAVNGGLETELPDGAAIQYTVVLAQSGKDRKTLDGAGVSPDDTVGGPGNVADVLSGSGDAQYNRAHDWVLQQTNGQASSAPTPVSNGSTLPADTLLKSLKPLAGTLDDVPAGPDRKDQGYLVFTHPNELAIGNASDVPDADAFAQKLRDRHWQGSYQQFYGQGDPPPYAVGIDLYRDATGAGDALKSNDYPTAIKSANAPAKLGDDTVAYTGYNEGDGISQVVWRRGRAVFTVQYTAQPGQDGMALALALARRIDARAASQPAP
jgi:carboxyl-terminal processing protease